MVYTVDRPFDAQSWGKEQRHTDICYCPACLGLQCLERPRFFAGQLLTEAELNSEQAYVIAKNKLHNRYLHGWGVVCGLQVVCHPCDGWVTVKSGYALDPCGNDIIVCEEQNFDVIKSIKDCIESRRRKRRQDCDPLRPTYDPKCDEMEEHWCLTVAYEEKEARPITALRPEKSGGCGCGCNGNGKSKKCGCGAGGQQQGAATGSCSTPKVKSGVGTTVGACEPTRIFEQFRLQLIERPDHCGQRKMSLDDNLGRQSRYKYFGYINDEDTRRSLFRLMRAAPPDSAFMKVIDCVTGTIEFVDKRIPAEDRSLLQRLIFACLFRRRQKDEPDGVLVEEIPKKVDLKENDKASANSTNEQVLEKPVAVDGVINIIKPSDDSDRIYSLCCRLQKIVYELYTENPFNVRCTAECPPCSSKEYVSDRTLGAATGADVPAASQDKFSLDGICCSLELLVQYVIDCFCQALLPPCPPDPQDDRLVLACLTVKNGKIIDICNFSCRHYAGSFPAVNYWLSLVPVIPLITDALARFCCDFNLFDKIMDYKMPRPRETRPIKGGGEGRAAGSPEDNESSDPFSTLTHFGSMLGEVLKKASFTGTTRSFRERKERTAQSARSASTADEVARLRAELESLRDEVQSLKEKG